MFKTKVALLFILSVSPSFAVLINNQNAAESDVTARLEAEQLARASRGISHENLRASSGQQDRASHATAGCPQQKRAAALAAAATTTRNTAASHTRTAK